MIDYSIINFLLKWSMIRLLIFVCNDWLFDYLLPPSLLCNSANSSFHCFLEPFEHVPGSYQLLQLSPAEHLFMYAVHRIRIYIYIRIYVSNILLCTPASIVYTEKSFHTVFDLQRDPENMSNADFFTSYKRPYE